MLKVYSFARIQPASRIEMNFAKRIASTSFKFLPITSQINSDTYGRLLKSALFPGKIQCLNFSNVLENLVKGIYSTKTDPLNLIPNNLFS